MCLFSLPLLWPEVDFVILYFSFFYAIPCSPQTSSFASRNLQLPFCRAFCENIRSIIKQKVRASQKAVELF